MRAETLEARLEQIEKLRQPILAAGDEAQAVYLSYFTLGGILCLTGALLFWKRNRAAR